MGIWKLDLFGFQMVESGPVVDCSSFLFPFQKWTIFKVSNPNGGLFVQFWKVRFQIPTVHCLWCLKYTRPSLYFTCLIYWTSSLLDMSMIWTQNNLLLLLYLSHILATIINFALTRIWAQNFSVLSPVCYQLSYELPRSEYWPFEYRTFWSSDFKWFGIQMISPWVMSDVLDWLTIPLPD